MDKNKQYIVSEHTSDLIQYFEIFSSITTESFYVLDILRKQFCFIKPHDLFLCGFSIKEAVREGYNFYPKIIFREDLPLCIDIIDAILKYLRNSEQQQDEINYFSCTFRLQRTYSFHPQHPLSQMIYNQIKPMQVDGKLRYLICSVESSTAREAGNLQMHSKGKSSTYEEYNFITKRWQTQQKVQLTEREKAIIMLAEQGKTYREIAYSLCKGEYTVRNQIKLLFSKLNTNSMHEAIELACHQQLMY